MAPAPKAMLKACSSTGRVVSTVKQFGQFSEIGSLLGSVALALKTTRQSKGAITQRTALFKAEAESKRAWVLVSCTVQSLGGFEGEL